MATTITSLTTDSETDIHPEVSDTSGLITLSPATSPKRPTSLYTKLNNTEAAASSADTTRQSPINATATTSGSMVATLSPNSSTSSITSPSTSNFSPEMPQWKKDLIQRRKSNVARTIVASASPVQPHSPSLATSTSPPSLMGDHAADVLHMPTTPTKGTKQIASQYDTLTSTVIPSLATGRTVEPKIPKTINFNKMPATMNSPTKSPTSTSKSAHNVGGHYTPEVELKLDTNNAVGMSFETQELQTITNTVEAPIPKQRSTFYFNNGEKSTNHHHQYNEDQNGKKNEANSTENEREASASINATTLTLLTTRLAGFEAAATTTIPSSSSLLRVAEVFETQETETARKQLSSTKCGTYTIWQSHSKLESERTLSLVSSELPSSPPSIGKIYSKDSNSNNYHAVSGVGIGIGDGTIPSVTIATVCNSEKTASQPVVCVKISSKLQNNQFIKNQVIYNQQKSYENFVTSPPGGSITTQHTSPTAVQPSTSPNKFANNIKKKMVAVHELKKTTPQQHTTHQLHQHHHQHGSPAATAAAACGRQRLQQRNSNNDVSSATNIEDFDPSEDLSYGPGIVSKLRCRYLSLALRESMEKERHCLDNLRRATSLNNLLDRNDDDDEDDDDDQEESVMRDDEIEGASEASGKLYKPSPIVGGGILKRTSQYNQAEQQQSTLVKKTSIYQKHSLTTTALISNGSVTRNQRVDQKGTKITAKRVIGQNNKIANENLNGTAILRHGSRHLKRGNDSLKRARSVEALLCEKTPWNFAINRSSLQNSTNGGSGNGGGGVTIEDKIHNARERLILGTDALPPRRLNSIIDDTERPPPDLVKQTLKMFEATANRRGRGGQRGAHGGGEVASKVANYKSIIKEQKPPLAFPKQPISPNKKLNPVSVKHAVKSTVGSDLLSSPIGRKTTAAAASSSNTTPNISELDKQLSTATTSTPTLRERVGLSAISTQSDVSQRHKFFSDPKSELLGSCVDSPVSSLTKKLEKLYIENEKQPPMKHSITSKETSHPKAITSDVVVSGVSSEGAPEYYASKKLVGGCVCVGETNTTTTIQESSHHENNTENLRRITHRGHSSSIEELDTIQKGEIHDEGNTEINKTTDDEDFVVEANVSVYNSDRDNNAQAVGIGNLGSGTATSSSSDQSDDDESGRVLVATKRVTKKALENIAKAGTTQQFKFSSDNSNKASTLSIATNNKQIINGADILNATPNSPHESTCSMLNLRATTTSGKQIGVIRPLLTTPTNNQHQQHMETLKQHQSTPPPQLTSREIEKNRINEMKKTAANASSIAAMVNSDGIGAGTVTTAGTVSSTTSLDTVINTNSNNSLNELTTATSSPVAPSPIGGGASGFSELDASNSPLWALRKKRQTPPAAAAENTTMVFNFRDREKVPDYIENDGVIFRRKRVLPKPNESGFVRLPDLSLETSTDSDYDDFSLCPPSPCDVQFENANIVIDGKSSIRHRSKEATFRVQFNDTLTSTFEYPSEASLILEESFEDDHYVNSNDIVSAYENLVLEHIDSATSSPAHHYHHVAVDEIIPLPTTNANTVPIAANVTTPTKNILGNLPLGSAPLGLYTPMKAPIDNIFQLGVTRAPDAGNSNATQNNIEAKSNGSITGDQDDIKNVENGDDPDSLQYIKPANDNLTIAYSEGTQKTDLLY